MSESLPPPSQRSRRDLATVGFSPDEYPAHRNIVDRVESVQYMRLGGVREFVRKMLPTETLRNQRLGSVASGVDLLHLFNGTSHGPTPWVSTFESVLPRFDSTLDCHWGASPSYAGAEQDSAVQRAMDAMASPSCVALLALSECCARMQADLNQHFPEQQAAITAKTRVLPPPQRPLVASSAEKRFDFSQGVHFMFVGRSFFRKGGSEILRAFARVRRRGALPIRLTLVSALAIDSYATGERSADVQRAAVFIRENSSWIRHFPGLPGEEVLALMQEAHVGLLPTHADTYGYSVLEFQAAGCPVITTDVRALPEINDNRHGFMIEVPKNRLGEATFTTPSERQELSRVIEAGLERTIQEILSNPEALPQKSVLCRARIEEHHSPTLHAALLEEIYQRALPDRVLSPESRKRAQAAL